MKRVGLPLLLAAAFVFASATHAQNNATPPANQQHPVSMVDEMTPLENEQADLSINLAHSLAREKKFREALQAYQEFVKVFPMSSRMREARESMARIYERRQRYDLAIRQYEALYRELGIGALGLLYHLEAARLYEVSGDEAAAVAIYKELNQIDPGSEAANKARVRMEALNLMQKSGDYISKETAPPETKKADTPNP